MTDNKDIIEEVTLAEDTGKINISDDVVASIAGIAASEIEGVAGMSGSMAKDIAERFGAKKSLQKGVKVAVTSDGAVIDLFIIVDFGIRIPELAWEIQENVKNSVESMTGINVQKVNVSISGVSFEKKKKQETEPETEDAGESEILDEIDLGETIYEE